MSDFIYDAIKNERIRQDKKWGEQNHSPSEWVSILGEEYGEVCKEVCDNIGKPVRDWTNYQKELIQVAAVCVSMIESLNRGKWK
jgi:NTP pyrophosphatase (non-canonical NTP hydrolase)